MSKLVRAVSLPLLTLYGLGTVIGAGIYVLVGKVAGRAGALAPTAFLLAAGVAVFSALSFAELAARLPKSGGEASYVEHVFRRRWLSVSMGVVVMLTGIVSAATLAEGFAGYFRELWPVPVWSIELVVLLVMTSLAVWGVVQSVWVAAVSTMVEVGGLLFVVGLLGSDLPEGTMDTIRWWPTTLEEWMGVGAASFLAFYAFIGFEDIVNMAEEVKRPERAIPAAIGLVVVIVTALYLAIVIVALAHATPAALGESEAPLADLLRGHGGWSRTLITAVGLVAVINGALVQIVKTSRVLYGMADQGLVWSRLSNVWGRTRTPVAATLIVGAAVTLFALCLPLTALAELTSFLILVVFFTINVALFVLKGREPTEGFAVPIWWPAAAALTCAAMIAIRIAMLF